MGHVLQRLWWFGLETQTEREGVSGLSQLTSGNDAVKK